MHKIYSVQDKIAGTYIPPFCMKTNRDAIEGFRAVVNEKETPYSKFPEDYALVTLGLWDERTGCYDSMEPEIIIQAIDLKKLEN